MSSYILLYFNRSNKFTCKTCNKNFTRKDILLQHGKLHTKKNDDDDDERKVKCTHCGAVFRTRHQLLAHNLVVHRDKRNKPKKGFNCRKCNIYFDTRAQLTKHQHLVHRTPAQDIKFDFENQRPPWEDESGETDHDLKDLYENKKFAIYAPHQRGRVQQVYNYPTNGHINLSDLSQQIKTITLGENKSLK